MKFRIVKNVSRNEYVIQEKILCVWRTKMFYDAEIDSMFPMIFDTLEEVEKFLNYETRSDEYEVLYSGDY